MKILKYKADTCADLQSTDTHGAGPQPPAIQFTPASGVKLFTIRCLASRDDVMTDPSAPISLAVPKFKVKP